MNVPHIDSEGKAVRVKHWIIEMQARVDVSALLRGKDDEATAIVNAGRAAQILESAGQVYETNGQVSRTLANIEIVPNVEDKLAETLGIERVRFDKYSVKKWGAGGREMPTGGRG